MMDRELASIGFTGTVAIVGVFAGLGDTPDVIQTVLFSLVLLGVFAIAATHEENHE